MATDPESWHSVAERLEIIREAMGMGKGEIAAAIGCTAPQWTNYIKADNLIPVHTANRLCRVAGVTTEYIYRGVMKVTIDPEIEPKLLAGAKPKPKKRAKRA